MQQTWYSDDALQLLIAVSDLKIRTGFFDESCQACRFKMDLNFILKLTDGRVNFISQADDTSGSRLHELVKIILEKIAADAKYLSFPNAKSAK